MTRPHFPHLPAEAWELFLRDALDGPSLQSLENHLAGCAACSRSLEQADASFLFRRLREVPLREDALDGLWAEVRAELRPADAPAGRTRERFALLAGAATVLLAALTLQALLPGGTPSLEPCAQLALSSDECRDLFLDVSFDEEPTLFVQTSADLAELL